MLYPILTASDASTYLYAKRGGNTLDLDRLVKQRGDGPEMDQGFLNGLRSDLSALMASYVDGLKNPASANQFEADASARIHRRLTLPAAILGDADFWLWLSVAHFSDLVEWRYGSPAEGTAFANYGIGARTENLMFRLWLRAELVLDEQAQDKYHLSRRGQIDFYRSHLFRQGYANARDFARALIRFQYPHATDGASPHLKIIQIRELVKRLRRLRANLFLEVLDEPQCRKVIEEELERMPVSA